MAFVFHRGLAIPLWAIAFFAVVLAAPPRPIPPITVLVGIAVLALTMMAMVQWRRTSRAPVGVLAVASHKRGHAGITVTVMNPGTRPWTVDHARGARTHEADDALDIVRMDDGAWQMARARTPDGPSTMDAATIAERQREGGGAPSQRRPACERSPRDLGHTLRQFCVTTLFPSRVRTNHV